MIVTCPACSTRYLVDPRALSATGRVVRCANCAHTWHQTPPEDAPQRVDLPPLQPPRAAESAPNLRSSERIQLPAVAPRRRHGSTLLWALYVLGLLVLVLAGLWITRNEVVAYWPESARYYQLLGIPVAQTPGALNLQKLTTSHDIENGLPTLVIQGEVVNVSRVAQEVPKLTVVLRDANEHDLASWSFTVTDERLLPGASVPFRTSVAEPGEAAKIVLVTLGGEK
jgi:predicted Zn finger-like uncharacterized protein